MFTKPSGGEYLNTQTVIGHLLYIPQVGQKMFVRDKFNGGDKEAYKVTVVDLDGDATPRELIITSRWLVADLTPDSTNFLGRVIHKDTGRQMPAIVWEAPGPDDEARAVAWIEKNQKRETFAKPAPKQDAAPADDMSALLADLS